MFVPPVEDGTGLVSMLGLEPVRRPDGTRSSLMPSGIQLAASSFDTSFDNVKRCGYSGVCGNNSSADFQHTFRMVLQKPFDRTAPYRA
jgi:hypothetical protein